MAQPAFSDTSGSGDQTATEGSLFCLHWKIPKAWRVTTTLTISGSPMVIPDINNQQTWTTNHVPNPPPQARSMTIAVTKDGATCDFPSVGDSPNIQTVLDINDVWDGEAKMYFRDFKCYGLAPGAGSYVITSTEDKTDPPVVLFSHTLTVTAATSLSPKRLHMLETIDKWMNSSLTKPKMAADIRNGNLTDIFSLAHWSKDTGQHSADVKTMNNLRTDFYQGTKSVMQSVSLSQSTIDAINPQIPGAGLTPLQTSCGDIMAAILTQWGVDWNDDKQGVSAAFGAGMMAMRKGYYVSAFDAFKDGKNQLPKPGDLLILRNDGPKTKPPYMRIANLAHVCICYSVSDYAWLTADGGGGVLPDQVAAKGPPKILSYTEGSTVPPDKYYGMDWEAVHKALVDKELDTLFVLDDHGKPAVFPQGLPCIASTTDLQSKMLDGWVDLDRVPNMNKEWHTDPPDLTSVAAFNKLWDRILAVNKK